MVLLNIWPKIRFMGLLIGCAIIFFSHQPAKADEAGHQVCDWPHKKSDLLPDPDIRYGCFPNGFRYVLMENHEPRERVSMHLNVQVGSLNESDDQRGIAHFLEHMQFNGSTHFKPGELVKYFQGIGMQFGPDANAHTGFMETVYDVVLPRGDLKHIREGLLVLRDYADGALLTEKEIDRERGVILAEKRNRDSASYRTFEATLGFEFPEALISSRLPIGEHSVINAADRRMMTSFYDTWYRPEKMVLVVVGDFDSQAALPLIKEKFFDLAAKTPVPPEPDTGKIHHQGDKAFYYYEPEAGNTSVSIEAVWKVKKSNDSLAYQQQVLVRKLANQMVQNRLSELVRKPGASFTTASIGTGRYLGEIEFAQISASCAPEKWASCLSVLEQALRKALLHGFTPSELDRVKKDFTANYDNAVKQAATRKSREIAREIIRSVNNDHVLMSPREEQRLFVPFIDSLKIDVVHAAFEQTWAPGHRLILVTGNAKINDDIASSVAEIHAVIQKSKKTPVAKPEASVQVRFPYLSEPKGAGVIVLRKEIADLGIAQIEFENGVRLNLKKTDFEAGKFRVTLSFGEGKKAEPADKPGLSVLAEDVVSESGLGGLTKDELERAMAGKEAQLRFQISDDYFSFTGSAPSQELSLMFQLLHAQVKDPGFRAESFALVMARFEQMYLSLARKIDGAMQLEGVRFLAGGDTRFGLPPRERFERLTLQDVQAWIKSSLGESRYEISMVGDFDVEKAIKLASTYFGTFENRKPSGRLQHRDLPKFPEGQSLRVPVDTEIKKGLVVVAYPTEDFWNIQRTRRLSVLGDIFSEKLRVTVREKLGVSYSPYAYNRSSRAYPGYGILQAFVYIDPAMSDRVIREVKKIVREIADGVTQEDLTRSLGPILTGIKEMRRKNSYWLQSVLVGSLRHPEQIAWSRSILSDYAGISPREISTIAKAYLKNGKAAQIVVYPQ